VTNDKKQPGLPVVEVDQAFPLMTTDGVSRSATSTGTMGDQGPAVTAAIRDVLGWRPRVQDPKAFTAALSASFQLSTVEDHVVAQYVPRGVAVQADLGGVTGGQASLYLRAKASHEQIVRMLDSLQPLRTDADPQDCEAYRGLVRDSVRRIVMELGREGGPRVPLVDSAFSVLTGFQPSVAPPAPTPNTPPGFTAGPIAGLNPGLAAIFAPQSSFASSLQGNTKTPGSVPTAVAEIDPDSVPGQLGALRDRFGLDDDHVNTVDEEKQRTSFWTLVELITDLQRSWDIRRLDFTLGAGNGFLGTDLVQISRLLAAASEQVDEFEAVLDSVLVSSAERQTVVLDRGTGLTLDDLVQWLRVFFTEDGPNIIRDTGRDGLVSSFTPTAAAILLTLRDKLVRRLVPCGGPSCAGGCHCGSRGQVTCIPLGCCTHLPPGMYAGRVKIAVSTLCGLVERLTAKAIRIGRFSAAVLLDLSVVPFDSEIAGPDAVRVEVRGLHLRPTYLPAFVADGGNPANFGSLVLPLQGSASADADHVSGIFQKSALPEPLQDLLSDANGRGLLMAASEVPLAIIDGELGRVVQGPAVTTWPQLQPAGQVIAGGGPADWGDFPPNQRFVPQSPPAPVDPEVTGDCLSECGDDCDGCDCDCHPLETARQGFHRALDIISDPDVEAAAKDVRTTIPQSQNLADLLAFLKSENLSRLVDAIADADRDRRDAAEQAAPADAATTAMSRTGGIRARRERASQRQNRRRDIEDVTVADTWPAGDRPWTEDTEPDDVRRDQPIGAAEATETGYWETRYVETDAVRTAPTRARFFEAEPTQTDDVDATQQRYADAEPTRAEDVDTDPTQEPYTDAEPTRAEDVDTDPTQERNADAEPTQADDVEAEPTQADDVEAEATEPNRPDDQPPEIQIRSESELAALNRLLDLVAEQSGRLDTKVKQIQDSPQIRRFVVTAVQAARRAQAASDARTDEKER
jgi:hypothetical protein